MTSKNRLTRRNPQIAQSLIFMRVSFIAQRLIIMRVSGWLLADSDKFQSDKKHPQGALYGFKNTCHELKNQKTYHDDKNLRNQKIALC